ncbi:hypothetical protein RIR_jg2059.t1 [Rhizophagus irregularis DAOM 181602=DAOM 197198]|nr:hypothetical protein RIR_jg2059.t1 [Rhizophagus irregularis DAOM 181602=DAOM 197198]
MTVARRRRRRNGWNGRNGRNRARRVQPNNPIIQINLINNNRAHLNMITTLPIQNFSDNQMIHEFFNGIPFYNTINE